MHSRNHQTARQYDSEVLVSRGSAMSWYARADCRVADPELFFPVGKEVPGDPRVAAAKAVCRRCSVRDDCFSWVTDHPQDEGIWAGLGPMERRRFTRRQQRSRSAQEAAGVSPAAETFDGAAWLLTV